MKQALTKFQQELLFALLASKLYQCWFWRGHCPSERTSLQLEDPPELEGPPELAVSARTTGENHGEEMRIVGLSVALATVTHPLSPGD